MRRGEKRGMTNTAAGLLAIAIIAIACYFGFTKAVPFRDHFEVRAVFQTGNNLAPNSPVRIAGVNVGKVTRVEHSAPGDPTVTAWLRIDENGRPIHKDARATVRPRIFLEGNFFVDLQPGTPSKPELGDDDVIPVNQTASPVQLDQVLTALQSDTRDGLKVFLREYASGLRGEGARGFNRSIPYWKGAYRDGAIAADASLGLAQRDLSEYERNAAKVAAALDRSPAQLKSLITDFQTTAAAFAREDRRLQSAVAELPRTLRAAHPALGALNASFPSLRALARDLRPGVRSSEPALDASLPLVRQLRGLVSAPELRGLVADLEDSVPALTRLAEATVPLYEQVRLASSCQNEVILPWSQDKIDDPNFPTDNKVFQQAVKPLPGLAGESRSGDANGQWFRVLAAGGTNLIQLKPGYFATSALPIEGANPPAPKTRPPLDPETPCETQQPPDLRTIPGTPPPQRRIDTSSRTYQKRLALAQRRAVKWLKGRLKLEGLREHMSVTAKPVDRALVQRMAGRVKAEQAAARRRILSGARP